ncbi:E3 ubiquitin-protein ligase BRE1 [Sparassis crispa]|uniref:E3 ubiquitin protein ligase n=1 Tax=Sparassis crispa TaxID=139825 RepID=A0A401GFR8_9APHY|nr:E3 ubiquitin-protein ligase BRE1 [Sparassis crispa]GBE81020.1 E3 ubiquitin-protein ligase BRE1 [Sparassis crispa]
MASRKRSHAEDAEQSVPKKRAVSVDQGSPSVVNGVAPEVDEPKDGDSLEMFRKDAIYRRMKYYSREHERSLARVQELERRRSTCETGLAALEACWTQIIGTIRLLARPEDLPPTEVETEELFDLTARVSDDPDPEYINALRTKMNATSELVAAFMRLSGQARPTFLKDETYRHCQKAQSECSSLRSELSLTRTKLRDMESEKDKYQKELVAAEKHIDRLQSKTLALKQAQPVREEAKDESPRETPSSPAPSQSPINGASLADAAESLEIIRVRDKRISELEQENQELHEDVRSLKFQLKAPAEDFVAESPYYKVLWERASRLEYIANEKQTEATQLREQLEQLERTHLTTVEENIMEHEHAISDLKNLLTKRENDNLRLREQRDQQLSELNERKQKDHVKVASHQEFKALAESRSERIKVLESEVTRLKTRLAADACDEDLLSFFSSDDAENVTYVSDLKSKLAAAESRLKALEISISTMQAEHPDVAERIKAEAEARELLVNAQIQLERYQAVYGSGSSALPPDTQKLTEELQRKEDENRRLRLQEKQREQAEVALYAELDKLSAAWESLDTQVKSKVFELSNMEERLAKSGVERAKSENKFYSAMRDKEALEGERKNLSRNLEKQTKVIEKLSDSEKNLVARVTSLERETALWRKVKDGMKSCVEKLETSNTEWRMRAEGERKRIEEMRKESREQSKGLDLRRAEVMCMEDEVVRAKRDIERQAAKIKSTSQNVSSNSTTREAQLQSEVDKCMSILKCSTCKMNMRNTVITKCMHSFCKSCVDSRISTRQRKCPACNLPFSQGEVQQLYFQ